METPGEHQETRIPRPRNIFKGLVVYEDGTTEPIDWHWGWMDDKVKDHIYNGKPYKCIKHIFDPDSEVMKFLKKVGEDQESKGLPSIFKKLQEEQENDYWVKPKAH